MTNSGLSLVLHLFLKFAIQNLYLMQKSKLDISKIKTPTGPEISCKGWVQEAALRMLHNNLDPDVAERPEDLIVYGGTGKAARNPEAFHLIVKALRDLEEDENLSEFSRHTKTLPE